MLCRTVGRCRTAEAAGPALHQMTGAQETLKGFSMLVPNAIKANAECFPTGGTGLPPVMLHLPRPIKVEPMLFTSLSNNRCSSQACQTRGWKGLLPELTCLVQLHCPIIWWGDAGLQGTHTCCTQLLGQ